MDHNIVSIYSRITSFTRTEDIQTRLDSFESRCHNCMIIRSVENHNIIEITLVSIINVYSDVIAGSSSPLLCTLRN